MTDEPPDPERRPLFRPMSRESFEHLLMAVRNAASGTVADLALETMAETDKARETATMGDQRAVWHAAEVALAILSPGYRPKREALDDVRTMMAWIDDDDDRWRATD